MFHIISPNRCTATLLGLFQQLHTRNSVQFEVQYLKPLFENVPINSSVVQVTLILSELCCSQSLMSVLRTENFLSADDFYCFVQSVLFKMIEQLCSVIFF